MTTLRRSSLGLPAGVAKGGGASDSSWVRIACCSSRSGPLGSIPNSSTSVLRVSA